MAKIEKKEEVRLLIETANKPFYIEKRRVTNYAHDIGGCLRTLYYHFMGIKSERVFDINIAQSGKDIEKWIIEKCKIARIHVASNIRLVSPEVGISYEMDEVIADPFFDNINVPVEIKTCNHWNFITYTDNFCPHCHAKVYYKATFCKRCHETFPDPITEVQANADGSMKYGYGEQPYLPHVMQLMVAIMDNDFPHGYLVYVNKNTSDEAWFFIEADPKMWDDIKKKIRMLNDYVAKKKVPDRDFEAVWLNDEAIDKDKSDHECVACPFPKYCWGKIAPKPIEGPEDSKPDK